MKRKIKYAVLCIALLAFALAVIVYPERYVPRCFEGFAMWAECVLPSLFPFMVITLIFVKTGIAEKASLPLKKVTSKLKFPPAAAACFLLAVCSGYPAGSRVVAEFYESGALTKSQTAKTAYLCSASGPLFIIGSVGFKMFGDKTLGLKILLCHVFAIVLVSVIISLFSKKDGEKELKRRSVPDKNVLYNSFYGAVTAVCTAGGFIAFFYVVSAFCADFSLFKPLELFLNLFMDGQTSSALCSGLVEATAGCRALSAVGGKLPSALAGFLITFGGVSILLQQLSYLIPAGVNPFKFAGVKLIQAGICFGLLMLIA